MHDPQSSTAFNTRVRHHHHTFQLPRESRQGSVAPNPSIVTDRAVRPSRRRSIPAIGSPRRRLGLTIAPYGPRSCNYVRNSKIFAAWQCGRGRKLGRSRFNREVESKGPCLCRFPVWPAHQLASLTEIELTGRSAVWSENVGHTLVLKERGLRPSNASTSWLEPKLDDSVHLIFCRS